MSSEMLYSEIFEAFVKAPDKAGKIAVLQRNYDSRFLEFLECAFNPGIIFDVEIPEYTPDDQPAGMNHSYLDMEMNKMYRFIKNHPKREYVEPSKLKRLLEIVLISLHKDEADLLVRCMKKKLGVPLLTPKLIREAYASNEILGDAK
jgi:hypothetical protein